MYVRWIRQSLKLSLWACVLCLLLVTVLFSVVVAPPVLPSAHSLCASRSVRNILRKNVEERKQVRFNLFLFQKLGVRSGTAERSSKCCWSKRHEKYLNQTNFLITCVITLDCWICSIGWGPGDFFFFSVIQGKAICLRTFEEKQMQRKTQEQTE